MGVPRAINRVTGGVAFRAFGLAVGLVLLLVGEPGHGRELSDLEAEVVRIEGQYADDAYGARQAARALRHRLEEQLIFERGLQVDRQDRAEDWNRLAESAFANAAEAERSAARWQAQADDPSLSEAERDMHRSWAQADREAAERARARARDRVARAKEFEAQANDMEPSTTGLMALADRLDALLGRDVPSVVVALEGGDLVPAIPIGVELKPVYDAEGYFAGWDNTMIGTWIDLEGDVRWDGNAGYLPEVLVQEPVRTTRIDLESVVRSFRQLVPSIVGHFDPEAGRIVPRDYVEHSVSGPALIAHWTEFAERTAKTLDQHRIHRDQFEPFFSEFAYEYRRILNYQRFLSERELRRNVCEGVVTGTPEAERGYYCGDNRIPSSGLQVRDFLVSYPSELYWAKGVDPWSYMEDIASTSRPSPLVATCVPFQSHPPVSDIVSDFLADLEAADARSQAFWEEADQFYREEWLPHRVMVEPIGEGVP